MCLGGSDGRVGTCWDESGLGDHRVLGVERNPLAWDHTACLDLSLVQNVLDGEVIVNTIQIDFILNSNTI